jgi:precorrin-3B C17-methyltransferase
VSGRLSVVGLGPGGEGLRTPLASKRLAEATDLVGYGPYLDQVGVLPAEPRRHASDNRQESARARVAIELACRGGRVAVVSSGDPGVFAMATAVVEELHRGLEERGEGGDGGAERWASIELEIIPGVTAATAAAALVGAPLGHDFCVISLSDVLKPWEVVEGRLSAAAGADFVLALYNPISSQRPWQLGRALDLIGAHRRASTPVAVVKDVGRPAEWAEVVSLDSVPVEKIDMRTVLLVGSSTTRAFVSPVGRVWMYTPRRYP